MFDNDNTEGKQRSNAQLASCFNVALNDLLNGVEGAKHIESNRGYDLIVIEVDFESCIKTQAGTEAYNTFETEAKNLIKPISDQQKGVISRFIARKLLEHDPTFVPVPITKIKELVVSKLELHN